VHSEEGRGNLERMGAEECIWRREQCVCVAKATWMYFRNESGKKMRVKKLCSD